MKKIVLEGVNGIQDGRKAPVSKRIVPYILLGLLGRSI
jgi:hypothetical protein